VRIGVDPGVLGSSTVTFESSSQDVAGTAGYCDREGVRGHGPDFKNWTDDAGHHVGRVATGAFQDSERPLSWLNPV
jgi:hypothetical protein